MRLAGRIASDHARKARARRRISEDIRSAAMEGLVRAARDFDPSHGSFTNYAFHRITGAVLDYLRIEDHIGREHRAAVKAGEAEEPPEPISLEMLVGESPDGDCFPDPNGEDPEAAAERNEAHRRFVARVGRLPRQLRTVLVRRYGRKEQNLAQIGAALGVTESRACQLLGIAHRKYLALAPDDYDLS